MIIPFHGLSCGFMGLILVVAGCSKNDSDKAGTSKSVLPDKAVDRQNENSQQTADAAVLAVVNGFRENRPQVLWEFLPQNYQQDINSLAHDFSGQMDPELWSRTVAIGQKLTLLLKSRREDFLTCMPLQNFLGISMKKLTVKWDGLVGLLETMILSDLSDLERMKAFDGQNFFTGFDDRGTVQLRDFTSLLFKRNPFHLLDEMLDGAEVTAKQTGESSSLVRITTQQGETREFEFVKVEGKWIPKYWAETWKQDIKLDREQINKELDPKVLERKKQSMLPVLAKIEKELNQLQNAESREQFHAQIEKQILAFVLYLKNSKAPQAEVPIVEDPPVRKPSSIQGKPLMIIINAVFDKKAESRIADQLLDAIEDQDQAIVEPPLADARTTRIRVFPVTDVSEFAKRLNFVTVLQIDAKNRIITVEPKSSLPKSK
jgi:hypothetical protein